MTGRHQRDAVSPLAAEIVSPSPTARSNHPAVAQGGDQGGRGTGASVGGLRRRIASVLAGRSDTAALDARFLVAHVLGRAARDLALLDDKSVSPEAVIEALALAERRKRGEPVGRIIGEREFWGLPFSLSPATLEPRPDTETVVSAALAAFAARREEGLTVLDLGTGTGAILLALLSELPRASGLGVDRDFGAAATARLNARRLGLARRATFLVGNWADAVAGGFDLVVSNPPYIPSHEIDSLPLEVRSFDPYIALNGGKDGLNGYQAIIPDLPNESLSETDAFSSRSARASWTRSGNWLPAKVLPREDTAILRESGRVVELRLG